MALCTAVLDLPTRSRIACSHNPSLVSTTITAVSGSVRSALIAILGFYS